MKRREGWLVLWIGSVLALGGVAAGDEGKSKAPSDPAPPPGLARLDIANSKEGSIPGGASVMKGTWSVDAAAKKLLAAPEPLVDAWLEFGPEVRGKGAAVTASVCGPGGDRLRSRFGVGLYGKNGFQLRFVPVRQEIELVHRGEVLLSRRFPHDPADLHLIELSVRPERRHWIVSGRAWKDGAARPEKPLIERKVLAVELLFPLAGRSVLFATPFSGEPVAFGTAELMPMAAQ